MSFESRYQKAKQFELAVERNISELGFEVARTGSEYTVPSFVGSVNNSQDQTSLAIRFSPDGIGNIKVGECPRSFYWEAKAGISLEKTAYKQYEKLSSNGNILVIVFSGFEKVKWQFFDDIKLVLPHVTLSRFDVHKRFPDDGKWIYPRQSNRFRGLGANHASGTPYAEVNPNSLNSWQSFRELLTECLYPIVF